ncbi:unnamed protein product [Withania somnifera]
MAEFDSVKYPSLPSKYVMIAHLQERWLKEKQRKQQEKEKEQSPVHQNRIVNGKNHSVKGWREVAKEPKLKEVKSSARVVEESLDGTTEKKNRKMGYFGKRNAWVERDGSRDMAISDVSEKEMMSVENGGEVSCEGKCKEVEEVGTVCAVEVVGESNVDREIEGKKCGVGFWGEENSWRKMGGAVGEVSEKGDSVEQSGRGCNGEKEKVLVDVNERINEKVRIGGIFCAHGEKEVGSVCTVEVVGESDIDKESVRPRCGVGYKGKESSWGGMGDGVGILSEKEDSVEQSGQESNGEKEMVSVEVEGKTNEKVRVSGAFGDKEVEEVANVCAVEVVEENEENSEITGQEHRVGFRGKKHSWKKISDSVGFRGKKLSWRKIGNRFGEVSSKAESPQRSGQECNAENEEVSVDVKEGTNEKVRVKGAFRAYGDKSIDVPLIDSEAGVEMKIERDLGNLSLSNRRYGHGRSSVGVYDDKRRYASSRRYEPRKMLKLRDNSFVWVKKGESSNGNIAEIEAQVAGYAGFPI